MDIDKEDLEGMPVLEHADDDNTGHPELMFRHAIGEWLNVDEVKSKRGCILAWFHVIK